MERFPFREKAINKMSTSQTTPTKCGEKKIETGLLTDITKEMILDTRPDLRCHARITQTQYDY
jgi:hypothetical protein